MWASNNEVIAKTRKGLFLVQSPNLDADYQEIAEIPNGFEEVGPEGFIDIADAIPDELF